MKEITKEDDKIIDFVAEKEKMLNHEFYSEFASEENLKFLQNEISLNRKQLLKFRNIETTILKQQKSYKKSATKLSIASALTSTAGAAGLACGIAAFSHGNILGGSIGVVGGAFVLAGGAAMACLAKKYFKLCNQEQIKLLECQNDIEETESYMTYTRQELEICKFYLGND